MQRYLGVVVVGGVLLATAACGSSKPAASTAANTATPMASPVAAAATVAPAIVPTASGATGRPGANPATRVDGTLQTFDSGTGKVTLADGTSFTLAANARVTKLTTITPGDLKVGQFVAVTAKRQPDNTLLASIVSVFPVSLSTTIPGGQRPLPQGNLMTNATIASITGNSFTVTFTGGGANVTIAPDAQVLQQTDATTADLTPGVKVSTAVVNGSARMIQIQ